MRLRRSLGSRATASAPPPSVTPEQLEAQIETLRDELRQLRDAHQRQGAQVAALTATLEQLRGEMASEKAEKRKIAASQDATDYELQQAIDALQKEVGSGFSSAAAAMAALEKRMAAAESFAARAKGTEDSAAGDSARAVKPLAAEAPSPPPVRSEPPESPRGDSSRLSSSSKRYGGGGDKCFKCGKTVYAAESFLAQGHVLHRECFRCAHCDAKLLNSPNWEMLKGDFFCQAHFLQRVRTDGGRAKNELQEKEIPFSELQAMILQKLHEAEQQYEDGVARARMSHS
ncbi:hypothetical protein AB1Y20_023409 [Prymnesium parvum]|uniref:LIM zinc-binding domain-containing protein n=1 Tax=Prymnesium parvum TaxID=97485 RepID=A0AB34JDU4_PRYPA